MSDRARGACGLISSRPAQPPWATSAFVIWSRFYHGVLSPLTSMGQLVLWERDQELVRIQMYVINTLTKTSATHPSTNKTKPNSNKQLQKWLFWITFATPDLLLFISKRTKEGERVCKAYTNLWLGRNGDEIFHFPVSVIILPTIPNPIPDLREGGQNSRAWTGW